MAQTCVVDRARCRDRLHGAALAACPGQPNLAHRAGRRCCCLFVCVGFSAIISRLLSRFDLAGLLLEHGGWPGCAGDIFHPDPDAAGADFEIDGKGLAAVETAAERDELLESEKWKATDGPAVLAYLGFSGSRAGRSFSNVFWIVENITSAMCWRPGWVR